jgi:hypothetical protein
MEWRSHAIIIRMLAAQLVHVTQLITRYLLNSWSVRHSIQAHRY